ncbi:hypothetical protein [Maribacter sp. IgM3_T14_3]|uniref:hypothetical protein n=1 Tax=Maribacter sp. IgM3_T14_3 TaxID=3415140 RepID=UPI003C6F844F
MKSTTLLFVSIFLLLIYRLSAQVTNKTYDEAFNDAIAKQYPKYHTALLKVLDDFEQELIIKEVFSDGSFENYVKVLTKISKDSTYKVVSEYAIGDSVIKISKHYKIDYMSILTSDEVLSYSDNNAKNLLLNEKSSAIAMKNGGLTYSDYASILLEVYDERDFQLPIIKLKIFKFIDPNTNGRWWFYY